MQPELGVEMKRWAQEPGSLTNQRKALVQSVRRGDRTFEEAKAEAAKLEHKWLIDLVRDDDKEPAEAEAAATRLGCGPLIPAPDPLRLDPMREAYWTLQMVFAWIMWRTADDVRRHWDAWRVRKKAWQANGDYGYSPTSMERTSYEELRHDELITQPTEGNVPIVPSDKARLELWRALEVGALIATGIDACTKKRIEIPAHEFNDLNLHGSEDGLFMGRGEPAAFLKVRFKSADILKLWSGLTANKTKSRRGRPPGYDYAELRTEMERLIAHHGPFSDDDRVWNSPEKLISALASFTRAGFKSNPHGVRCSVTSINGSRSRRHSANADK